MLNFIDMEFSKKIIIFISVFSVIVAILSIVLMWRTGDLSALAYLIPSVFTELTAATGFYYWKARTENKIKLLKKYGNIAEKAIESENEKSKYNEYYMGM